jgi:hypothetical protein
LLFPLFVGEFDCRINRLPQFTSFFTCISRLLKRLSAGLHLLFRDDAVPFLLVLDTESVRVERIVSHGHASPQDFWYDQDQHAATDCRRSSTRHQMAVTRNTNKWRLFLDCIAAAWYMIRMPGRSHRGPLPLADDRLAKLSSELRRHVTYLADEIGERNVRYRPDALAQTAKFIAGELADAGYAVQTQEYDVDGTICINLEVEILGTTKPDEIVIVGAHYDSVADCPAANDNGSGVAALLNLACEFCNSHSDRTLRFVAFVNEEEPYAHTEQMGSWVYARRCRQRGEKISAMLSLETIGCYSDQPGSQKYPRPLGLLYPSTGNFIAFVGNTRYGPLVRRVVRAFRQHEQFPSQAGAVPEVFSDIGRSDHWPFWQEGYPAVMVTDTAPFRYAYYHTPEDTVDKIDFERMARVVRGLRSVVKALVTIQ